MEGEEGPCNGKKQIKEMCDGFLGVIDTISRFLFTWPICHYT